MTDDQRAALAAEFLSEFEAEARANYAATRRKRKKVGGGSTLDLKETGNFATDLEGIEGEVKESVGKRSRDKLAEIARVGSEKAKKVIKLSKTNPSRAS